MATTWTVVVILWLYTLTSHLQLFIASDVITDRQKLQDGIMRPIPISNGLKTISWDFLVLALQWPQSSCDNFKDKYNITCQVPTNVDKWTVHGLWPSKFDSEDVFNCNTSYPFNSTQIKDLLGDLEIHWPNLLSSSVYDSFWAHEWNKHGTCASILPPLAGEYNYFKTTMQFLEYFPIDKIFEAAKLVPSESQTYKGDNFTLAINKSLNAIPVITCYTTMHTSPVITYLQQLELCLDKTFKPFDCPHNVMGNCGSRDIIYPPITHDPVRAMSPDSPRNLF